MQNMRETTVDLYQPGFGLAIYHLRTIIIHDTISGLIKISIGIWLHIDRWMHKLAERKKKPIFHL